VPITVVQDHVQMVPSRHVTIQQWEYGGGFHVLVLDRGSLRWLCWVSRSLVHCRVWGCCLGPLRNVSSGRAQRVLRLVGEEGQPSSCE